MPDFTGYTYTTTTGTAWNNPFSNLYASGGGGSEWTTTVDTFIDPIFTIDAGDLMASHYCGAYSDSNFYDRIIEDCVQKARDLAARVGENYVHFVMGTDIFASLRDTGIVPNNVMEKYGVVGYIRGFPINISPDDSFRMTMLAAIYEPNSAEPEQYRKGDYVLNGDIVWQVSNVDEDGTINLDDTGYHVLTGEQLAHPSRGKSGTVGTLPSIKRSPPPPPTQEEFRDLFGDVLPEET
jgi:hypothetical protein